jgi:hypothetical protein
MRPADLAFIAFMAAASVGGLVFLALWLLEVQV